jgi:hypothetical protein
MLTEVNRKRRGHGFYPTKSAKVPALYSQGDVDDPIVRVHYFVGQWDWYILEWDAETGLAFGFCKGMDDELGYVSLPELEAVLARGLFPVERDLHWTPVPLSKVKVM